MKGEKVKIAKGKLLWGAMAFLAFISLVSSVGYYISTIHGGQAEYALKQGKRFTLSLETGALIEENTQTAETATEEANKTEESEPSQETPVNTTEAHNKEQQEAQVDAPQKEQVSASNDKPEKVPPDPAQENIHKAVVEKPGNGPKIVLLVTGLGLSRSSTERALSLPPGVTLGFSPYSLDIKQWVSAAAKEGHEVLINLPLEAADALLDDPGSFALVSNLDAENNLKRLDWVLTRTEGYVGVYSDPQEKFTEFQSSIRPVLKDLQKRGIPMVYGAGYSNNSVLQLAKEVSQPLVVNDVVVDTKISAERIKEALDALEHSAKRNGYAVGMGAPYPITIKVIESWIPTLKEKGIELVPVSVLLNNQHANPKTKTLSN